MQPHRIILPGIALYLRSIFKQLPMKNYLLLVVTFSSLMLFGQNKPLAVHAQYLSRLKQYPGIQAGIEQKLKTLNATEAKAFEFMYAYMPLSDLADYSPDFFTLNLKASLDARRFFAWGKNIPDNIFYHFVLPVRVNTENLDTARMVFYRELKGRIANLNMHDAVLEVNHWCHEKVSYRAADMRTSGPLATVKTSYGRCGEESTFTVSALRAVGIPARQVYTPRWAHTDDNHAWVEAWVDGKWFFLGACEPEPDLNMGWFAGPVKRAMMLHTNVFGAYQGPEEAMVADPLFTRINLMTDYAPTRRIVVKATGNDGKPAAACTVKFKLYNYAEFYTLSEKTADENGEASILTGYGDLLVWALKDNVFGYAAVTVENTDTLHIKLDKTAGKAYAVDLKLVPPVELPVDTASRKGKDANARRIAFEDSLLKVYRSTFRDSVTAVAFALSHGYDPQLTWHFLALSHGNYPEIEKLMRSTPKHLKPLVLPLLGTLADKDLRDVPSDILMDHLTASEPFIKWTDAQLFDDFVLAPRIAYELITPYKRFISSYFDATFAAACRKEPLSVASWLNTHIALDEASNYYHVPITPAGVLKTGVADGHSRDILFVAICRTFGVPARLDPATRVPQYFGNNLWNDVVFSAKAPETRQSGAVLVLSNDAGSAVANPVYTIHYSIARFRNGDYETLDYETDENLKTFPCALQLEAGDYMLVTGNRTNEGTVYARLTFFRLENGRADTVLINVRPFEKGSAILGKLDMQQASFTDSEGHAVSLASVADQAPVILCFAEPGKEPTNHAMVDMGIVRASFVKYNAVVVYIFTDPKVTPEAFRSQYKGQAAGIYGYDVQGKLLQQLGGAVKGKSPAVFPVIALLDASGNIHYISEGYTIGIGAQLVKNIQGSSF